MTVEIPVHGDLQAIIEATPSEHTTLVTEYCGTASRRLADAGCTAHEIVAITGHQTLQEAARCTRAVDCKKLGASAMAKIGHRTASGKPD